MPDKDEEDLEKRTPTISFAKAVGEAGHEVADLGLENVPDSGPLLRDAGTADMSEDGVREDLGALTQGGIGPEIAQRDRENSGDDPR